MAFMDTTQPQFLVPELAHYRSSETKWPLQKTFWFVIAFCAIAWGAIIAACIVWL